MAELSRSMSIQRVGNRSQRSSAFVLARSVAYFCCLAVAGSRSARAGGRLRRPGTQADSQLHLYGLGYADALHDRLHERCRSKDQGGAGAVFAGGTLPSRQRCRSWRRIATCASSICRSRFIAWARSIPARFSRTGCSICRTNMLCPADASTRCMDGTATSSFADCCARDASNWRAAWSTTSSSRSSTTARCSTRTARII